MDPVLKHVFSSFNRRFSTVSFSPDGRSLVAGSSFSSAITYLWDVESGTLLKKDECPYSGAKSAFFSPDGKSIVTLDSVARIWSAETGKQITVLASGCEVDLLFASFSPDGTKVIASSKEGIVIIFDVNTGIRLKNMKCHFDRVNTVFFSFDGNFFVTASDDKTSAIWDANNGNEIRRLKGHKNSVNSAVFSPDGTLVVTASEDKYAILWDESGELKRLDHSDSVEHASFSLDGKLIVTASFEGCVCIWSVETGEKIKTINHDCRTFWAVFSPDGRLVATAGFEKMHIWDIFGRERWKKRFDLVQMCIRNKCRVPPDIMQLIGNRVIE